VADAAEITSGQISVLRDALLALTEVVRLMNASVAALADRLADAEDQIRRLEARDG
jgi:hypothetical protein